MAIFAALKKERMFNLRSFGSLFLMLLMASTAGFSQSTTTQDDRADDIQLNTITTAVPFLMISPDARAGAMGDVGAATDADGASIHWNPAKMAFIDNKMGFAVSYTPWLRALVPDINLAYISGYGKIGKKGQQTLSGSLRFFSLGSIQFTDNNGTSIGNFTPSEFSLDVSYARKLSREFSGGISLRYIYSNLTGGINVGGADTKAAQTAAADISFYYKTNKVEIAGKKTAISAGINISNIGGKVAYTQTNEEDFIPINFRFGVGFKYFADDRNSIGVYFDINKLMVPTPPTYGKNQYINDELPQGDSIGQLNNPANLDPTYQQIIAGKDPNRSVPNGMFTSFADAPGGSAEELREINLAIGLEYWYNKLFAIRAGYFHEHYSKGNRQFFTVGAGIRYNVFGLDFAYLIPTTQRNPLENTLRFTLTFDFEAFKKQNEEKNNDKPED
ncbi:MAG: type IX secretion system outer membrane channel protein PorV [Flavobacteriales bacterium]|nr:type IX secretion system outer membrane channel protein PorV [Flavobacteriales bacterium]